MRIAILQADTIHPNLQADYLSYGNMFQHLLTKAAKQLVPSTTLSFQVFDVSQGQYPEAEAAFDAYLITGSKADSFSDEAWVQQLRAYVQQAYQQSKVLLGICFGHQLIALALGGVSARASQGWGIGSHPYQLQARPSWWSPQLQQVRLLVSHQDQVQQLPSQAELLLSSEFCPYAAFYIRHQVLCFQGHPEFTPAFAKGLLATRRERYTPTQLAAALASYAKGHDGDLIALCMLQFVQQAMFIKQAAANQPLAEQSSNKEPRLTKGLEITV